MKDLTDQVPVRHEPLIVLGVETDDSLADMTDAMKRTIGMLLSADGIELACSGVVLGRNGAGYIARWIEAGGEAVSLAQYWPKEGFELPVHVFLVDANGLTSRVILQETPSTAD